MSGSQPLAPGELHPARKLRREALRPCASLRHPLILDGFSDFAPSALRRDRLDSAPTALRRSKCLHVLSSFQRTGTACFPPLRLSAKSGPTRSGVPPSLSSPGEPSNLTRGFRPVSIPCARLGSLFVHGHARAHLLTEAPQQTAWGIAKLKDFLEEKKFARYLEQIRPHRPGHAPCRSIYVARPGRVNPESIAEFHQRRIRTTC